MVNFGFDFWGDFFSKQENLKQNKKRESKKTKKERERERETKHWVETRVFRGISWITRLRPSQSFEIIKGNERTRRLFVSRLSMMIFFVARKSLLRERVVLDLRKVCHKFAVIACF